MKYNSNHFRQRRARRAKILERLAQTGDKILEFNDRIDEFISDKNALGLWGIASTYLRECRREYQEAQEKWFASLGHPDKEKETLRDLNSRKATLQGYISSLSERRERLFSQPQDNRVLAVIKRIDEFISGLRAICS